MDIPKIKQINGSLLLDEEGNVYDILRKDNEFYLERFIFKGVVLKERKNSVDNRDNVEMKKIMKKLYS